MNLGEGLHPNGVGQSAVQVGDRGREYCGCGCQGIVRGGDTRFIGGQRRNFHFQIAASYLVDDCQLSSFASSVCASSSATFEATACIQPSEQTAGRVWNVNNDA